MAKFPTQEWLQALEEKLNSDSRYGQIAHKWEGDLVFQIEPGGNLKEETVFYLDLWHGKCRRAFFVDGLIDVNPVFTLRGPYEHYIRLLRGDLDPMQALLTRKLTVQGNLTIFVRNVPTVLDFVRCCKEVTDNFT